MAVISFKKSGKGRPKQEFAGLDADRTAKTDNVPGDIFYVQDGLGKLVNAWLFTDDWQLFEVYNV